MSERSISDMSLKPGDHEFFVKVHDDWEKSIKADFSNMLSAHLESIEKHISSTYDHHAKIICDVVRQMLLEQNISTEKMVRSIVAEQNADIFKKIDAQNKIINQITRIQLEHSEEIKNHEKRLRILEKKLADLLVEHNTQHKRPCDGS